MKLKPSTTHKLHWRSRSVAPNVNELEQLALDVRAEKQLWKEAAQRTERKMIARKPTSGMASIPEDDVIPQPVDGWSRLKASTMEGRISQAHASVLPCLAEQDEGADRDRVMGTPTDLPSPKELLGDGSSGISDIVFTDRADVAEAEGTLIALTLANMRSPVPSSLPGTPSVLGRPRPESMRTFKEYPPVSTRVFSDRKDTELDPDVPEESILPTPRSRPALRRVVRRIDFEECHARRAVTMTAPSAPLCLDLNTTAAPQHLPFCFESFGYMASFLLGIPQPEMGSEQLPSKSTFPEANPTSLPSKRNSLLIWETEREMMESHVMDLTAQLTDAVEDIRNLLTQLHHTQNETLLRKGETAARVEGFERDIKVLKYEALVAERANKSLCAENDFLRVCVFERLLDAFSKSDLKFACLHNFTAGVHPQDRPMPYLESSASIYSSPVSSFEGTPQLSSGTSSLPITPCDRTAPLRVVGRHSRPGCAVHIQDHSSDELQRACDGEEAEEELEGLDVDLGDMRQIPQFIDEMMPAEGDRALMQEEGHQRRCRSSSREDEDETMLFPPMAEELQLHENPPPRKLYSSWREVAAEQDLLRKMRI